ncbi:MAG: hypothetical protein AAGM36_18875 [Cyanobacteria bacterium J06597_1]
MANRSSSNYTDTLKSVAWKSKRTIALRAWGYRCSLRPWVNLKGKMMHLHHTNYNRVGRERIWFDVVPLSEDSHRFLHRWLGGHERASYQQSRYPNWLQKLAHAWCRLTVFVCWVL